jgi:glutathione S-transferase
LPSAIERYTKEINRVTAVLEGQLARQKENAGSDGPWLVGNKLSYADISFIPWQGIVSKMIGPDDGFNADEYPHVKDWLERMTSRKAIKKVMDDAMKGH